MTRQSSAMSLLTVKWPKAWRVKAMGLLLPHSVLMKLASAANVKDSFIVPDIMILSRDKQGDFIIISYSQSSIH